MELKYSPVKKAVFPVAGLGTRFLPATKASPKEMLAIVNKPLIQYAVEEAYTAGIREMIFVTAHNKDTIADHFDAAHELESELTLHNKMELLALVQEVKPDDMDCVYIRQPKALGLGHAILCAEKLIDNEPFAILLPDDLLVSKVPVMKQMVDLYNEHGKNIIAVQNVLREQTINYGIIDGENYKENLIKIDHLVEKPCPEDAPSTIGIVGRYILNSTIFQHIRSLVTTDHCEIQITDAIKNLLQQELVLAYNYEGVRYDCGSMFGFLKANVDLGKAHPLVGKEFNQWLQENH